MVAHDVSRELRDPHGRWTETPGGLEKEFRKLMTAGRHSSRAPVQTPTTFRHPDTGHSMGKSEIGDTFEHLFDAKGRHLIEDHFSQPYIMIAGVSGAGTEGGRSSRGTPLDFRLDETHGGELKTLNKNAKNQKTAIKKEETARKRAATDAAGLKPLLVVQVVDMENQRVNVFYFPDFSSKAVARMTPLGSYEFNAEDFKNAQQATGHWEQRHGRARRAG